jgi:hypothetical protein
MTPGSSSFRASNGREYLLEEEMQGEDVSGLAGPQISGRAALRAPGAAQAPDQAATRPSGRPRAAAPSRSRHATAARWQASPPRPPAPPGATTGIVGAAAT